MKKKSSKKQKVNTYMAENGYQMPANPYDPWQMNSMNFQMPQMSQFQPMGQTMNYSPAPQDEMRVIPTGNVAYDVKEQNNKKGNKFGKTAQQIGQMAGQFMSDAIGVGIPALNALIPEQQDNRQKYQPIAYNPYSMGTGSQGIYEDGGYIGEGVPIQLQVENNPYKYQQVTGDKIKKQSFGEAFRKARKELGPGQTFKYNGKTYTTDLASELSKKETHSPHERATYTKHLENKYKAKQDASAIMVDNQHVNYVDYFPFGRNPIVDDMMRHRAPDVMRNPSDEEMKNLDKPLNRLQNNERFNKWATNVAMPALEAQGYIAGVGAVSSLIKKGGKKIIKKISKTALDETANMANQVAKKQLDDLALQNLEATKKANPYPINQWSKQGSPFEFQSNSPVSQYLNTPEFNPNLPGSPYEQMMDMEHAFSPATRYSNTFSYDPNIGISPYQQVIDMEHAWSPIRRAGILPDNFKDGGYLPNGNQYSPIMQDTTIKRRKKGNIQITEEVPNNMPNLLPEVTIYGNRPKVATPAPEPYISFDRLHTPAYPNSWTISPTPHNMSMNEFFQQVQNTPNYIDGYQVEKSPDFIKEGFTGQYPNWQATHDFTNTDYPQFEGGGSLSPEKAKQILKDGKVYGKSISAKQRRFFGAIAGGNSNKADAGGLITYEDGGDIQPIEAKNGNWIPKHLKKGRCTPAPNPDCPKGSPQYNLAMTFKKHHGFHKKEDGGYISGQELDLSPEQIQALQDSGYDLEFL